MFPLRIEKRFLDEYSWAKVAPTNYTNFTTKTSFAKSTFSSENSTQTTIIWTNSSDLPTLGPPNPYQSKETSIVAGSISAVAFVLLAAMTFFIIYWRRRYNRLRKLQFHHIAQYSTSEPNIGADVWEIERNHIAVHFEKQLGSGAFGRVYQGTLYKRMGKEGAVSEEEARIGRSVAVKMLPEHAGEISKEEFQKEISLMKDIGPHPHVVSIVAAITLSHPIALIVEFCNDGDLHSFLRSNSKNVTWERILSFAWQISDGLLYIAQKGFLHRDVAARNILVHNGILAKVGDFGLCRFVYDSTSTYMSKGGRLPLKWMALESLQFNEFTTQTDIWAFGVLLYELASKGGAPYPTVQPYEMETYLRAGKRMAKPDNCPEPYFDLALDCWKAEPSERPSFEKLRSSLYRMLEAEANSSNYYLVMSEEEEIGSDSEQEMRF